jgi:alpha-L-fucosidase
MKTKPTGRQLEFQDWELGIFLHFGIRTFYEGHRDWDGKKMEPSAFNPTALDCEQWVSVAKAGGARYMVLVAKHHDGFANWPSRYTDFSVAGSPWRGGKGNVVEEFTRACHKHDMKVGLYYSPADWSCPAYKDAAAYDDYFINQISEILKPHGQIDMLWFDGCGSEKHTYDWRRIIAEVRAMQPGILIFNMGDPDYRWCGNEAGLAPYPYSNVVDTVDFSVQTEQKEALATKSWLPVECDLMMRDQNWFYEDADCHTAKSPAELMGVYDLSVGRGANMLLNIGPDRRGLLPDPDAVNLAAFGDALRKRFAAPVAGFSQWTRNENTWTLALAPATLVDTVVAMEDLTDGEAIRRFEIRVVSYKGGKPVLVYEGRNIGHKHIATFPLVRARSVQLTVTDADGDVVLRDLQVHRAEHK